MTDPGTRRAIFTFAYRRSPDQDRAAPARHPVVIIGAGPVGLTLAIDLAQRGVPVVLLDDADRIGEGSRGICYAKRTLEIWHRLGVGERMLAKGVTWQHGKVFRGDDLVYAFDLLPEDGHRMPAFINLQQYYVEAFLVERARELPLVDLRWRNRVIAVRPYDEGVRLAIDTPDGPYSLEADWLVACDGARSPTRAMLGVDFVGEVFEDRFLIADVKMAADLPAERRFWFEPTFHAGQSALLHRQPDDVWRVDLQLGWEADATAERAPERVIPRLEKVFGHRYFSLEWVSVYTFQCRRIARFVQGRVIFAGDAAHQVSPFGARGANSGVQDADNLGWKLARVVRGESPAALLDSYDGERSAAADENIGHSTRSTDFIAPRSRTERLFRDAVLDLAPHAGFARRMVNSGRLSLPSIYETPLSAPDEAPFAGRAALGGPMVDAPVTAPDGSALQLVDLAPRDGFWVIHAGEAAARPDLDGVHLTLIQPGAYEDPTGRFAERWDARPGSTFVLRPDQHLCARFRRFDADATVAAIRRASALN